MNTANNVINIRFGEHKNRNTALAEPLNSAKRIAENILSESLDTLFENTDDSLFEYADKAVNNEQQTIYLHAMRDIRLKKTGIKEAFFAEFDRQFHSQLSTSATPLSSDTAVTANDYPTGMGLSLVDEDELDESLAITNMLSRVHNEYREALSELIHRINEVCEGKEFHKESNPLSPDIICNAFAKALSCLPTNLEVRLILYKLFEEFVARNLGKLYHDINRMFVAVGILPTIKYKTPIVQSTLVQSSLNDTSLDEVDSVRNDTTDSDNALTHSYAGAAVNPSQPTSSPAETTTDNARNSVEAMRRIFDQFRSDTAAHDLQADSCADIDSKPDVSEDVEQPDFPHMDAMAESGIISGADATIDITANDNIFSPNSNATGHSRDDTADDDDNAIHYVTSDIISGLSRIQNNTAASDHHHGSQHSGEIIKSNVLQSVQAHNQEHNKSINNKDAEIIDIVSMMFDYILADTSLPDRSKAVIARLQIPIVKVAILDKAFFSRKNHPARALLNELANTTNILDGEYKDSEILFREIERIVGRILNEFDSNMELFRELLAEFADFQAREIQANHQAEQLILDAKHTVAAEIEKRLLHHKVPAAISRFILGPWKEVMTNVGMRDRCEGIAWSSISTFLDDLIWSVQPKHFNDERRQLTMMIPRMLIVLQEGFALLNKDHSHDLPGFLEELQKIHLDLLHVQNPVTNTQTLLDNSLQWDDFDDEGTLLNNLMQHDDKNNLYQFDSVDPRLKQSKFFNAVRSMELGTWVEFKSPEGSKRGKLTWKCDITGEYTFMNRLYKVVADIDMGDLINRMEDGSAGIVEDTPMFDRAVNAVMNGMKNLRGTQLFQ